MNGLREKIRNKKGFTLVEMLIVVAIIAILIAISIPMIGTALEGSRHAVDQANIRDAISLGSVEYLTNEKLIKQDATAVTDYYYVVDPVTHQGSLVEKGTTEPENAVKPACKCGTFTDALMVTIDAKTGSVTPNWKVSDAPTGTTEYTKPSP